MTASLGDISADNRGRQRDVLVLESKNLYIATCEEFQPPLSLSLSLSLSLFLLTPLMKCNISKLSHSLSLPPLLPHSS